MSTTSYVRWWRVARRRAGYALAVGLPIVLAVTLAGVGPAVAGPGRSVGPPAAAAVPAFALSLWLSHRSPSFAFYLLPARAWELGIGAMLAAGAVPAIGDRGGADDHQP